MRAWQVKKYGRPTTALEWVDVPEPIPAPGEILVRTTASVLMHWQASTKKTINAMPESGVKTSAPAGANTSRPRWMVRASSPSGANRACV